MAVEANGVFSIFQHDIHEAYTASSQSDAMIRLCRSKERVSCMITPLIYLKGHFHGGRFFCSVVILQTIV